MTEILFPTQFGDQPNATSAESAQYGWEAGGPLGPVRRSFTIVPEALGCCDALAPEEELASVLALRSIFRVDNYPDPYMNDISRAVRLIRGAKSYLENGTFDRGNLAYIAMLLAEDAVIVGVDIQDEPLRDEKLRNLLLKTSQTHLPIIGDSRLRSTRELVKDALQGHRMDAAFVDGDHTAPRRSVRLYQLRGIGSGRWDNSTARRHMRRRRALQGRSRYAGRNQYGGPCIPDRWNEPAASLHAPVVERLLRGRWGGSVSKRTAVAANPDKKVIAAHAHSLQRRSLWKTR
jgi:hypothetical protein